MTEFFICDTSIFDKEPFYYIRERHVDNILLYLKGKHFEEQNSYLEADLKRSDLIIWNALLAKEVANSSLTIEELAKPYNYFYNKISKLNSLKELQELEVKMFIKYVHILINEEQTTDHLLVNKILHYIYMNIENFISINKLCIDLNISSSYASAIFKKEMNTSIIKYSKKLKIERAKTLLKTTNESILSLSTKLGFHDESHFCRTFKEFTGYSPLQFRKNEAIWN